MHKRQEARQIEQHLIQMLETLKQQLRAEAKLKKLQKVQKLMDERLGRTV